MRFIARTISTFLRDRQGAVTVDYVVLSAAAMAVAVAGYDVVMAGLRTLAGNVNEESTGVDTSTLSASLSYNDGFENGITGWNGATGYYDPSLGGLLGPIAGSGGVEQVTRTFELEDGLEYAEVKFDMYSMDSLDGDSGFIYVGGQKVGQITRTHTETTFTSFDIPGITITGNTVAQNTSLGGTADSAQKWEDALTEITIQYESPDPFLTIGFGSDADQDADNEFFAIDNFTVSGLKDPGEAPAEVVDPGV